MYRLGLSGPVFVVLMYPLSLCLFVGVVCCEQAAQGSACRIAVRARAGCCILLSASEEREGSKLLWRHTAFMSHATSPSGFSLPTAAPLFHRRRQVAQRRQLPPLSSSFAFPSCKTPQCWTKSSMAINRCFVYSNNACHVPFLLSFDSLCYFHGQ